MSLLSWLSGGTFEEHRDKGEALFEDGEIGEAILCYQRALKKASKAAPDAVSWVHQRLSECRRRLAQNRLDEAQLRADAGQWEMAAELLADCLDICDDDEIGAQVEQARSKLAQQMSRNEHNEQTEMSEEELFEVIAGTWNDAQRREFELLPPVFVEGAIAAHNGLPDKAIGCFKDAIATADPGDCRYIYLELARQYIIQESDDEAIWAINAFLERADSDGNDQDGTVLAHTLMGRLLAAKGDGAGAEASFMAAFRAAPHSHVPMLNLGLFLISQGELTRARRTLENARDTMGAMYPDMRVYQALGELSLQLDEPAEAKAYFKACTEQCCQGGRFDQLDPAAAVPLARIYEQEGALKEASDLYRHLARGYDVTNYFTYNFEAARLLRQQDEDADLIAVYMDAARSLATSDEERTRLASLEDA